MLNNDDFNYSKDYKDLSFEEKSDIYKEKNIKQFLLNDKYFIYFEILIIYIITIFIKNYALLSLYFLMIIIFSSFVEIINNKLENLKNNKNIFNDNYKDIFKFKNTKWIIISYSLMTFLLHIN